MANKTGRLDSRIKKLPIGTDITPTPHLSFARQLWQWLTPDTNMKRWTYAGLLMALFADEGSVFRMLSVPILTVSALYYIWQTAKSIRKRMLWKVRDRILVSFVFVGIVPISIIILMGGVVAWFLIGTLGSNLLLRQVETTVNRLDRVPLELQMELYRSAPKTVLPLSDIVTGVLAAHPDLPDLAIEIYERRGDDHELLYAHPDIHPGVELPAWITQKRFASVILDTIPDGAMLVDFRAGAPVDVNDRQFFILVSMPLTKPFQTQVWEQAGVLISSQFLSRGRSVQRSNIEADWSDMPLGLGEIRLPWASALKSTRWHNGDDDYVFLSIWLDPIRIVTGAMDLEQSIIRVLLITLIALCFGLACVEVVSLLIGLVISRRITKAVHDLSEGTQALRAGQLDFRINVEKQDQLGELSRSFNAMTGSIQVLLREVGEKERIDAELAMAREVQARLIPKDLPRTGRLELVGTWIPARMVSGDYYDFIPHQEQVLDIVVSDISGKGMSAALMMAGLRSALRSQSISDTVELKPGRLSTLVDRLNLHMCHNSAPEKFATLFICAFDPYASTLTYCCAGHNPPYLLRDGSVSLLDVGGCPIGLFEEWKYEERTIPVTRDDLFVIYTDGITEAQSVDNTEFGEERLKQVIMTHRSRPCEDIQEQILRAVRDFSHGSEQFDDQTVVIGRVR